MDYFPLFLDIKDKKVLVVGAGIIAWRKTKLVAQASPALTVVAPEVLPEFHKLAKTKNINIKQRKFRASDIKDAALIFVAVNDQKVRDQVHKLAEQNNIPINVVDEKRLCSFIMPALVTRDPLTIAISSAGKAPVVARRLREDLEARLPENYGIIAEFMDDLRPMLKDKLTEERRRHFYERLWDSQAAELLQKGKHKKAQQLAMDLLTKMLEEGDKGMVYFVGAGEGAPGNLTLDGLRQLHQADVILYDKLVNPEILSLARRDATLVAAGKPPHSQEQVNQMIIKYAKQGKHLVRLKGGDPAIFARLREEMDLLKQHNIEYKISPGITAALACAATAKLSLTDRDVSHGVVLLSLSGKSDKPNKKTKTAKTTKSKVTKLHPYIVSLLHDNARPDRTLVIYMGVENIALGVKELTKAGMDATTPAMIFEKVGLPQQKIITSCLKDLPTQVKQHKIAPPASIIIGKVATN